MLNILFIGDIVGNIGRECIKKIMPKIKRKYHPDLIIANAENLAHGKGVTENTIVEMLDAGVNFFTGGNHIFSRKNYEEILNNDRFHIIRPANYPKTAAGTGFKVIDVTESALGLGRASQKKILLINLMGRVFFRENLDCPFKTFDDIVKKHEHDADIIIVDFHAEATSEKKALYYYTDKRAQAVIGTHTHIQTNDEQISENGTAYITDTGAVAAKDSVLGVEKNIVINNFLTQIPLLHEFPQTGACEFHGVIITFDTKKKIATQIKKIRENINIQ